MMRLFLIILVCFQVVFSKPSYFYNQCDPRWANDTMGVEGAGERATICKEGCAMTCLAMALTQRGFTVNQGDRPNPKNLNKYLVKNQGYHCDNGDCNNLVLSKPDEITAGHFQLVGEWGGECCGGSNAKPSLETMRTLLVNNSNIVIIAHVRNSSHFVLLVSSSNGEASFRVLDPFFNQDTYTYDDISDIILYSVIPVDAYVPKPYRLFKQFDYRWKDDVIVHETIGEVGCLMSSTSMALNGHGIGNMDPHTLNIWLQRNHGYTDQDDMEESVVPKIDPEHVSWNETIGMHTSNDIELVSILKSLSLGEPVIANVMHGRHFVLVVGAERNSTTLYVNDPGFYRNTYDYENDVVGWRLFNMTNVQ